MTINYAYHPQFFTATIFEWIHLLKEDEYKDIIIKSLQFLKKEGSIIIYSYVIMPNHIHLIWQIQDGFKFALVGVVTNKPIHVILDNRSANSKLLCRFTL